MKGKTSHGGTEDTELTEGIKNKISVLSVRSLLFRCAEDKA